MTRAVQGSPYEMVSDMEEDVEAMLAYANAMVLIGNGLSREEDRLAVGQIADDLGERATSLHLQYHRLHEAMHPETAG